MKNFKQKLIDSDKKWDVIEQLFDELGIKHQGLFHDCDAEVVFVRVESLNFNNDQLERAMGLTPCFDTIGAIGVLTDKGPFKDKGSGWIYINYRKVLRCLG